MRASVLQGNIAVQQQCGYLGFIRESMLFHFVTIGVGLVKVRFVCFEWKMYITGGRK